ncbi:MAG: glycosyltransferase family 39 protein [Ferruginibacter sp.]
MELKYHNPKVHPVAIALIGIFAFFVLFNLGLRRFWLDECVSNILAANILKYNYPYVYDGTYFMTALNGNDSNEYAIEAWYSWLPFYIQALFMWLFGKGEFFLRLPNALFGIISAVYFYKVLQSLSASRFIQHVALLFYVFSVPVILYVRTAHYYAGVLCFTNMSLYYFIMLMKQESGLKFLIAFCLSMILFFHINFGMFLIPALAYILATPFFKPSKKLLRQLLIVYFIVFLFTAPWFVYILETTRGIKAGTFIGVTTVKDMLTRTFMYISKLQTYFFPLISIAFLYGIISLARKLSGKTPATEISRNIILLSFTFLFSTILINILFEPFAYSRRLLPAIPLAILLGTYILYLIYKMSKVWALASILLILSTNVLSFLPWKLLGSTNFPLHRSVFIQTPVTLQTLVQGNTFGYLKNEKEFRIHFVDLYHELTINVKNRTDKIIDYLHANALPGESLVCTAVEAPKIYYYTGLRIVNQLNPDGSAYGPLGALYYKSYPNAKKYKSLDYAPDDSIDWIIYQDLIPFPFHESDYLKKNELKYEKIHINAPNAFIESTSEPDNHSFRQEKNCDGIFIYHKW